MHPRPPGRHLREILSFRLKFSCLATRFHIRIPKTYLSVRLYPLSVSTPRKEIRPDFINISPTLVIDTSLEGASLVLQYEKKN